MPTPRSTGPRSGCSSACEAILDANLSTPATGVGTFANARKTILTEYGTAFYDWMQANVAAGNAFESLTAFAAPAVTLCAGNDVQGRNRRSDRRIAEGDVTTPTRKSPTGYGSL